VTDLNHKATVLRHQVEEACEECILPVAAVNQKTAVITWTQVVRNSQDSVYFANLIELCMVWSGNRAQKL
jgi:hypothetical protein